jgi:hypothetical protein
LTGLDAAEALALFHVLMEIDAPTAREHVQGVLVEHVLPEASSLEPWQREQLASTLAALGRTSTPS